MTRAKKFTKIPKLEATKILYKQIRDLNKISWMDYEMIAGFFNISKTTVSFAIKGRKIKGRKH